MIADFESAWTGLGLPLNEACDVGNMILTAASNPDLNGEAIHVAGGRGWPIEKNLNRLQPEWIGKEPSDTMEKGHELLGYVGVPSESDVYALLNILRERLAFSEL